MAKITTEMIKELRERTGAGLLDCKKALEQADGDLDKAVEILRKMGIAKADKKLDRETKEGIIEAYIHPGSQLGVLVEINCETDFVARTEDFKHFAHEIAMQIAAAAPKYVSIEDIPEEVIEKEKEIYLAQLKDSKKPPHVIDKIIEGKLKKFYQEVVLLEQPYIRDESKTIRDLLKETIGKLKENIRIKRFARFRVGEE